MICCDSSLRVLVELYHHSCSQIQSSHGVFSCRWLQAAGITPSCHRSYKVRKHWGVVKPHLSPFLHVALVYCGASDGGGAPALCFTVWERTSCVCAGRRGRPGPRSTSGWQTWDPVCDGQQGQIFCVSIDMLLCPRAGSNYCHHTWLLNQQKY